MKCLYCEKEIKKQFILSIREWDRQEGNLYYDDYYFCSEECLIEFLKRNLFRFLGKEIKVERGE
jgi:hypothetical protein